MVASLPTISVIIPTYNRQQMLRETLLSLAHQDWPTDQFEVIVVDDGSSDGTQTVATELHPFALRYIRQANQGDAAARNTGAQASQAEFLVFLDDDILVAPEYLTLLIRAHGQPKNMIVAGTAILWLEERNPLHELVYPAQRPDEPEIVDLPFVELCSNNMSLRREAYFSLGMMHKLNFSGSSMWCDVDFAYRAYQQGFAFRRSTKAICWHRDYVYRSLDNQKRRMHEAAYRAATLFQKYPDLSAHLPMFIDKTPVAWRTDPPLLIMRKLLRRLTSSKFILSSLERVTRPLEKRSRLSALAKTLYRWIIGAYIWSGYRKGLQELQGVRRE